MRITLLGIVIFLLGLPALALTVKTGTGSPRWEGWCFLNWQMGCLIGHGGLTDQGLLLSMAQAPPIPAYELNLRLIKQNRLLFFLESPNPAGKLLIYLDEQVVQVLQPTQGLWWVELDDLPSTGFLRIEIGPCTDSLLIRGIYYPCVVCPSCWPWLIGGVLIGAVLVWLIMR